MADAGNAPILVVQMQRMGDLVLSFPLLARLGALYPDAPIWVVGEADFFKPLIPLSPSVTYFGYDAAPGFKQQRFSLVMNLSHRPEAAALAGAVKSDRLLGPYLDRDGQLFIRGDWQLYRASLTHNNRYNLFHWADLHCLDLVSSRIMRRTLWPEPQAVSASGAGLRIGLFLGASEADKHPAAAFWAALAERLLRAGHRPVLLGGKAEQGLGRAVTAAMKNPAPNLCGKFSLGDLALFVRELDLFISPDTGPMHVAAWVGTPTLNLSMGPVNPWETGPFPPGHHVARARLDCVGCWRCTQDKVFCREEFSAARVAAIVKSLIPGPKKAPQTPGAAAIELLRSSRDGFGFYNLERPGPAGPQSPDHDPRLCLSRFWQTWFAVLFGYLDSDALQSAARHLRSAHPEQSLAIGAGAASFALSLTRHYRSTSALAPDDSLWKKPAPLLHPFSGYAQMYAQNAGADRAAFLHLLSLAEGLAELAHSETR